MTDVKPILDKIEATLLECDASTLEPLAGPVAAAALDFAEHAGFDLTPWQRDMVVRMYDPPAEQKPTWTVRPDAWASAWVDAHCRPGEPTSVDHGRSGWWRRLFKREAG